MRDKAASSKRTPPADGPLAGIDRALPVATFVAVGTLTFVAALRKIWTVDFWWQLRTGRWVAENGWPAVDPFSYALERAPWIELRWLFCWTLYGLFETVGPHAIVLVKALVIVAAFVCAARVASRGAPLVLSTVLTVAVLAASPRFFVRPEIVSWLLFGLFLIVLDRHRRSGTRAIWLLPALQLIWVNSHTFFIYGPALVGLMLGLVLAASRLHRVIPQLESLRPRAAGHGATLAAVLGATLVASLINPWGLDGLLVPFGQLGQLGGDSIYAAVISELQSPFAFGEQLMSIRWYQLLIALCAGSLLLNLRRVDPFWLVLCGSQLVLSLTAVRNLPLFCLAAVPFVVNNWVQADLASRLPAPALRFGRRAAASALLVLCAFCGWQIATDRAAVRQNDSNQFGTGIADYRYPIAALDYLDRTGVEGRLFATAPEAAYVLYRDRQVWADPRGDVYDETTFREFVRAQQRLDAWNAAVQRFDLRFALLGPRAPLVRVLLGRPEWVPVWLDETAVLFARRDAAAGLEPLTSAEALTATHERLRRRIPRPRPWAELGLFQRASIAKPYVVLADLFIALRQPGPAAAWLDDAAAASPFFERMAHRRVTLAQMRGDHRGVVTHGTVALEETPDDPQLAFALGQSYFMLDDAAAATRWLSRAVALDPSRATAWALLGELAARDEDWPQAVRAFERAAALRPDQAGWQERLREARAAGAGTLRNPISP